MKIKFKNQTRNTFCDARYLSHYRVIRTPASFKAKLLFLQPQLISNSHLSFKNLYQKVQFLENTN